MWAEVERKMLLQSAPRGEPIVGYKRRLRKTAFAIPKRTVTAAVRSTKLRAQAVWESRGGDIARD